MDCTMIVMVTDFVKMSILYLVLNLLIVLTSVSTKFTMVTIAHLGTPLTPSDGS